MGAGHHHKNVSSMISFSTSAVLTTPRNIIAPLAADFKSTDATRAVESAGLLVSGAALGGLVGYLAGGTTGGTLAGTALGAFAFVMGGEVSADLSKDRETAFSYDEISQAREAARKNTEGSKARKNGAAFVAGFGAAFRESYDNGTNLVDKSIDFTKQGLRKNSEFLSGSMEFLKGALGD